MKQEVFKQIIHLISKLEPWEWTQLQTHVNKKYSSKQKAVKMPSEEELLEIDKLDVPSLKD